MGPNEQVGQPAAGEFSSLDNINSALKSNLSSYDVAKILSWAIIIVAVVGTIAVWLLDMSVTQSEKQKLSQKDVLIQKISSGEYADLDQKVSGLKSAYNEIKKDIANNFVVSDFLLELYKKVDTDVQIRNISVTSEGKLNIDGIAGSYRAVADQMLALQNFSKLKNVSLLSTSMSVNSAGKTEVPFVFSADIDESSLDTTTSLSGNTNAIPDLDLNQTGGSDE